MNNLSRILEIYNKANNFGNLLGMNFELIQPGEIRYNIKVTEKLLATPTAMHGGAISAFMDAILGVAALSAVAKDNRVVSTVEFKLNFLKPALLNDELTGFGKVIQQGNRIIISEGKIINQKNEVIAIAIGTFNAYSYEKSSFSK